VKEQGAEDLYAVLSVGGFLGIGDKKVVVRLEELDVDQEGEIIMANVTEDQLRDMPEYNEEGYESTAGVEGQPAEQQQ
jgi:PRC-barrel domain